MSALLLLLCYLFHLQDFSNSCSVYGNSNVTVACLEENKFMFVFFNVVAEIGGKSSCQSRESELVVVTGRGRHSHNGIARLRPAIIAFLNSRHYQYVMSLHFIATLLSALITWLFSNLIGGISVTFPYLFYILFFCSQSFYFC